MNITQEVEEVIEREMNAMFPHGGGTVTHMRVRHHLEQVGYLAWRAGRAHALMGLMTAEDVALHFQISPRRARALIRNRHERFGVGMRFGNSWLVHQDELPEVAPDETYRRS